MTEPYLLGFSKPQWDLINGFAGWFAALGSIAAAGVALYLANRANKPSARVLVGNRTLIGGGASAPPPEFAMFQIVNTGDRPITIKSIGWKVGLFRKRFAVQVNPAPMSSPIPIELTHGQDASWFIPSMTKDGPWVEYFVKTMLLPNCLMASWTLRGQFITSVGHVFEVKPEAGFLEKLRAACRKVSGKG